MTTGIKDNKQKTIKMSRGYLHKCPRGWINFIETNRSLLSSFDRKHNKKVINQLLSNYKASYNYKNDDKTSIVNFDSESHYTLFVLTYGSLEFNDW
jgi:hypothetical protein